MAVEFDNIFESFDKNVIFNLSGVLYINSRGIKEIISLHNIKTSKKLQLVISGAVNEVKEILERMNIANEIRIAPSNDTALKWIKENS